MFRPYMWAIFRLRSNYSRAAIQECGVYFGGIGGWVGEGRGGGRDLVPVVDTMTWGYYKLIIISFLCTRVEN